MGELRTLDDIAGFLASASGGTAPVAPLALLLLPSLLPLLPLLWWWSLLSLGRPAR